MKLVTALVPKHSRHAIWTGLNEHDKEDDWNGKKKKRKEKKKYEKLVHVNKQRC